MTERDLSRIFKAYDVRGVVPDDLDADLARQIGAAYARIADGKAVLIGRDCRLSSPELAAALAEGVTSQGSDVIDLGLASTDLLYFASGSLDLPGIMLTASHNPKQYNGLKFCQPGARPVGEDTGLRDVRAIVEAGLEPAAGTPRARRAPGSPRGLCRACAALRRRGRDAAARRSSPTRPTGWAVSSCRRCSNGCPITAHYLFPRARRDVPEPSGRSAQPREPAGPEGGGAGARRRRRAGVRRRRRPRVPGGRARRGRERIAAHRDRGRRLDAARRARRQGRAQPDLLVDRARDDPRERRGAGAHTGRPLLHQAGDGRHRRDLRRRALGSLLLPRELPGRLGADRRGRGARRAVGLGGVAVGAPGALPALLGLRARSTRSSPIRPAKTRGAGARPSRTGGRTASTA